MTVLCGFVHAARLIPLSAQTAHGRLDWTSVDGGIRLVQTSSPHRVSPVGGTLPTAHVRYPRHLAVAANRISDDRQSSQSGSLRQGTPTERPQSVVVQHQVSKTGRVTERPVWKTSDVVARQFETVQRVQSDERFRPEVLDRVVLQPEMGEVPKVPKEILGDEVDPVVVESENDQVLEPVESFRVDETDVVPIETENPQAAHVEESVAVDRRYVVLAQVQDFQLDQMPEGVLAEGGDPVPVQIQPSQLPETGQGVVFQLHDFVPP